MLTAEKIESAIEQKFADEIAPSFCPSVELEQQVEFFTSGGNFRGDFVARAGNRSVLIECDGRQFHEFRRDKRRDLLILDETDITDVIRLRGCDLFFGADETRCKMTQCLPYLFLKGAPSPSETFESLVLTSAIVEIGYVKPILRTKCSYEMLAPHAEEIRKLWGVRSCTVCTNRRDVIVQLKSAYWDWNYEGDKVWHIADVLRLDMAEHFPPRSEYV